MLFLSLQQETSLRPDIKLGRVPSRSTSTSPLPPPFGSHEFALPHPSSAPLDYSSAFLCRLPLTALKPHPFGSELLVDADYASKLVTREVTDQSHLTQVVVGCEEDPQECPPAEEIVQQVRNGG